MKKESTKQLYDYQLNIEEAGIIKLPTGKIMFNDPLVLYDQEPYEFEVPAGEYPVYLHMYELFEDKKVAMSEIRFSNKKPVELKELVTCEVDSGIGAYMDGSIFDKLSLLSEDEAENMWNELNHMLEDNLDNGYSMMNYAIDNINIVGFSSGYGEGSYSSFLGLNEEGEICCLLTNYDVISDAEDYETQRYFNFGYSIDEGSWHYDKIEDDDLPLPKEAGYNHLAVFLRWMIEHNLLSEQLLRYYPTLPSVVKEGKYDLRLIIDRAPVFDGELCIGHFNEIGRAFAEKFYVFNMHSTDYYPTCVDDYALKVMGEERYNCEEYKDEAYLFMVYDEEYYQGLSQYIDKAWEKFIQENDY